MRDMCRECVQAVEDVSCVCVSYASRVKSLNDPLGRAAMEGVPTENSGTPRLAFSLEEREQVVPNKNVQVDCDLERVGGSMTTHVASEEALTHLIE